MAQKFRLSIVICYFSPRDHPKDESNTYTVSAAAAAADDDDDDDDDVLVGAVVVMLSIFSRTRVLLR